MRRRAGFTLIEGLFALFMVTLVLGGMVHTLNQAAQVKKNTKNLDQAIEDFHTLLSMEGDVNASLSLVEPSSIGTSNRLVIRRVDPRKSYFDRTEPPGDPLDPYEASEVVEIEYKIDSDYLVRIRREEDGSESISRLMRMKDFQVTLNSGIPAVLNVEYTVERSRVSKTRSIDIAIRALL